MKFAAIALLATLPAFCGVKVGDIAPPLHLQSLIPEQPVDASLDGLKGKPVVLEFWATWCGPCVDSIPHLNQLVDQFAAQGVQFISVTDEDPAVVEKFLPAHPIHGWVGIDRAKVMHKAYGFNGIPDTVLIGSDGKLAGISHPGQVNAGLIEDLLAARPLKLPMMPDLSISRSADDGPRPLLDIIVRPSTTDDVGGGGSGQNKLQFKGTPIRRILANAFQVPVEFVVGDAAADTTRYDVSIEAPGANRVTFQKVVPDLLCMALHVTAKRETRDTDGWILKAPHGKPEGFKETAARGGSGQNRNGELNATGMSMELLLRFLRPMVQKPVADQTGLTGRYDVSLKYDEDHPESIMESLRALGFTVDPGVIPTEFLVVTKP